jgi:Tol biopolymer transport system component
MTAFDRSDRFERLLPERLDDLAAPRIPDYFESILATTARTPQRPRWASLERWLPMSAISRTLPWRGLPWRPLLITALALAIAAGAIIVLAGASQKKLPPPFGPAGNGVLMVSNLNRDIIAVDTTTGVSHVVLPGAGAAPGFDPTGRRFFYDAKATGPAKLHLANADGSNDRLVWSPAVDPGWIEWSQDGKWLFGVTDLGQATDVTLIDPDTAAITTVHLDRPFDAAEIPYGSTSLVLAYEPQDGPGTFATARIDGTGVTVLPVLDPISAPILSPDGTRVAYTSFRSGGDGRIRIFDLQTGRDSAVELDPAYGWYTPTWMPDGRHLAVQRWQQDTYVVVVIDAAGTDAVQVYGTAHTKDGGGALLLPSPDGRSLIVRYGDTLQAIRFDLGTGAATPVPLIQNDAYSWQRVATP